MPRAEATILHADLDAFFASVEQRDDPRLRGRPMVVGRGVVLAASYEARAFGIHGAMGGGQARSLCPWVIAVDPRMDAYTEASRAVFDVFARTAPIVEGISIDEAFLDVGGLERVAGEPVEIARRLRHQVRDEVGLPITIGVASSKFLAKVASAVAKPDGLLHVPAGEELAFLHPLPVERLWGVGPVTARKLHDRGINTVGEVAGLPEAALVSSLGPAAGRHIHALANARDPRRVESGRRRRSMGSQRALGRRARPESELAAILDALCDRVTGRLRKGDRLARTIVLRLRFDDFARATRSHTLPRPTSHTQTVRTAARSLLATAMPLIRERGLTLIGVALSNLDDADAIQLTLPFDRHALAGLDAALDELRERFGSSAVMRAAGLGRELAPAMPVLPD